MQTRTTSILRTAWESVISLGIEKLPRLTADELTRLSWAKAVESYDQVPEIYQDFMKTLLSDTSEFPYAVLTPTFEGFIRRENEKLIFSLDSKIYVLERARDKLTSTCYPFEAISYIEVGAILLNSWIKIRGCSQQRHSDIFHAQVQFSHRSSVHSHPGKDTNSRPYRRRHGPEFRAS